MPFIVSLKHFFFCYLFSFFLGELMAPGYAFVDGSAIACILELQIAGCLLALFLPVVPTFGMYLLGQGAMHEQRVAIVAPGATQIDFRYIISCSYRALVEEAAVI